MKASVKVCWAFLFLLAILRAPFAEAQAPPGPQPAKPPVGSAPKKPAEDKAQIRVKVDLVATPVTVTDSNNEMVMNLAQTDFRIFDNGVEQRIDHFDLGADQLSLVFLFETSSRVTALLPAVRKAGIVFSQTVMGPNGEAAVLGFNDTIDTVLPFTSNADSVEAAIRGLPEGTSGSKLYDAMSKGVLLLSERPANLRRVLVVVATPDDKGSEDRLGQVLRDAQIANVTIYTVGLSSTAADMRGPNKGSPAPQITPPGTFPMPPIPGSPQTPSTEAERYGNVDLLAAAVWAVKHVEDAVKDNPLQVACAATGGADFSTFRDRSIEKAIDEVGGELHGQYWISYRPTGADPVGYHEIKVRVTRGGALKVRWRPGYYLTASNQ